MTVENTGKIMITDGQIRGKSLFFNAFLASFVLSFALRCKNVAHKADHTDRKLCVARILLFQCIYMHLPLLTVMKVVVNLRAPQEFFKM